MKHPDEHTIDLFILNPESLDPALCDGVRLHIEECAGCRSFADYLENFYRHLQWGSQDHSARVETLTRNIFHQPSAFLLRPFKPRPNLPITSYGFTSILAAMTPPAGMGPRFDTVATLASEEEKSLLRIRLDRATHSIRLYLHTDDAMKREGAIVSLPSLSSDIVLDERGQGEFTLAQEIAEPAWSTLEALIRLPVFSMELMSTQFMKGTVYRHETSSNFATWSATLSHIGGRFIVAVEARDGQPLTMAVMRGSGGETYFVALQDGKGEIALPVLPPAFVIRFYS